MTSPISAGRPAWGGWVVAVSVYLLAVVHRSSLGVAGLTAEQRFGITPAGLSVFVLLQLGVYAAMQVPAGVLVDRYGSRRVLFAAATLMGVAQLVFAEIDSYPIALLARGLLGCGDALTFVAILRFIATYFPPRRFALLVSLTAFAGFAGSALATLPLTLLLRHAGWPATFLGAGLLSIVTAAAVWLLLPDATARPAPVKSLAQLRGGVVSIQQRVAAVLRVPGTRLGFWVHFAGMSAPITLAVLWGQPYLVKGAGFSTSAASTVLLASVVTSAVASPLIGSFIGRQPALRVPLAATICGVTVLGWTWVLLQYGSGPPHPVIIALFCFTSLGSPASMIGFSLARDYNVHDHLGTASGVVNVGGFSATVLSALGVGWVLDAFGHSDVHSFRIAAIVIVSVQALGVLQTLRWWRRLRTDILATVARGEAVPVPIVRRRWDRGLSRAWP